MNAAQKMLNGYFCPYLGDNLGDLGDLVVLHDPISWFFPNIILSDFFIVLSDVLEMNDRWLMMIFLSVD